MSEPEPEAPTVIRGSRPPMTRTQKIVAVVAAVALVVLVVLEIVSGKLSNLFTLVALTIINLGNVFRPKITVDAAGIHRPWRRRRLIDWAEVDSIAAPTPGLFAVRLNLVGGKTVDLAAIPSQRSSDVAVLGGKQLVKPPSINLPRVRPGGRLGDDATFDIDERIRRLDRHRATLAADARQLGLQPHVEPESPAGAQG